MQMVDLGSVRESSVAVPARVWREDRRWRCEVLGFSGVGGSVGEARAGAVSALVAALSGVVEEAVGVVADGEFGLVVVWPDPVVSGCQSVRSRWVDGGWTRSFSSHRAGVEETVARLVAGGGVRLV